MPHNKNVGVTIPTVPAIMEEYIAQQGQPVSCKELVEVVRRKRPDLLSKNTGATLRSILVRDKRFVRSSRGRYDVAKDR